MGSVYEVVVHHMNCVVSVSILPIDILGAHILGACVTR